jgi:hypothetical protein
MKQVKKSVGDDHPVDLLLAFLRITTRGSKVVNYAIANTRFQGSNLPETLKELDAATMAW